MSLSFLLFVSPAQLCENFVQGKWCGSISTLFLLFSLRGLSGGFGKDGSTRLSSRLIFRALLLFGTNGIDGKNDQPDDYSDDYL